MSQSSILLQQSLQAYFYQELEDLNRKSHTPVSVEYLHYSSNVLEKYSLSEQYFEITEGKASEKILGLKLLETGTHSFTKQIEILKDIGDTALCLCGFFAPSMSNKIIDSSYYENIGKTAYSRLGGLVTNMYDDPQFYPRLSSIFSRITSMMAMLSELSKEGMINKLLLGDQDSEKELALGISKGPKVSN